MAGNLTDACKDVGLGLGNGRVCLAPPPPPGPGPGPAPLDADADAADDTAAAAARARASCAFALMSAKVRAPVRPGLLRGAGRGVLGETWPGDTGIGRIRDTGILSGGTFCFDAGDGVAGLDMDDAGGETDETEDTEETEDIRGLFSGVHSPSASLVDFRLSGSKRPLDSGIATSLCSVGLTTATGHSTLNSELAFGGLLCLMDD